MGKKLKIVIVVVVVIVGLFIVGALASGPYVNTDVASIAGVTQFIAMKDGSLYKMRFSLVDNDNVASASDADIVFVIKNSAGRTLYSSNFHIIASDFQQYQLILTGAPVYAYAWQVGSGDIPSLSSGEVHDAFLLVKLPDGRVFDAKTSLFG
jgi:hypothetical protein